MYSLVPVKNNEGWFNGTTVYIGDLTSNSEVFSKNNNGGQNLICDLIVFQ